MPGEVPTLQAAKQLRLRRGMSLCALEELDHEKSFIPITGKYRRQNQNLTAMF